MHTPFSWEDRYSVGHAELDRQHQQILQLCRKIRSLSDAAAPADHEMHEILQDMVDYAAEHFETEERILRAVGYPDIDGQHSQHTSYYEGLTELLWESMSAPPDAGKLASFLEAWWIDHILESDMAYRSYLENSQ